MLDFSQIHERNLQQKDYTNLPRQAQGTIRCIQCKKEVSQAGNQMYVWVFRVKTGGYQGQEIKEYTAIAPRALWKLKSVLEAIYDTKITGTFDFDDEDVLGKSCHAEMRISTYEGKEHIEIVKWSPIGKEN